MTFNDLRIAEPILQALRTEGYSTPTPIQQQAIPIVLQRKDLLGCAQTGTGKTAAFAIPVLQLLSEIQPRRNNTIRALILTPTRELAIQIDESFAAYGRNLRLNHTVVFGGVSQRGQVEKLRRGPEILTATPGRLLDLINQRIISLRDIEIFVLDEADRMLDMGFINDVRKIVAMLPEQRQNLFFSATMPAPIQQLADRILHSPEKVEVTPVSSTAEKIEQSIYMVEKPDKKALLHHVLKDNDFKRVLVFTRTKHGADKVVKDLNKANIKAEAIHGNKAQNARQRALQGFKNGDIRILVATDIAARGIDVDDISHVINYEMPNEPETYVHRIGRTARAGATGIAISFCDEEERAYLRDIERLIKIKVPVVKDQPYNSPVSERFTMPRVVADAIAKVQRNSSSRGGRNFGRSGGGRNSGSSNRSGSGKGSFSPRGRNSRAA
jgi:ATP-dependent RNA helicase RhlE